jgi:hypothetical protein
MNQMVNLTSPPTTSPAEECCSALVAIELHAGPAAWESQGHSQDTLTWGGGGVVGKFSQRAELRGPTGSGSGGQILNKTQLHAPGHTSSCCCIGSLALQFKLRRGGGGQGVAATTCWCKSTHGMPEGWCMREAGVAWYMPRGKAHGNTLSLGNLQGKIRNSSHYAARKIFYVSRKDSWIAVSDLWR